MIPHTIVLKPGLIIHSIYNGYWFWGRPSVDDLWRDLRAATTVTRPDWDLSTPGLRERLGCRRLLAVPRMGQAVQGGSRGDVKHLSDTSPPGRRHMHPRMPIEQCWGSSRGPNLRHPRRGTTGK